jgi:hypothetical protein
MRWWPHSLMEEACKESYQYFHKKIRPLPINSKGDFSETANEFTDNDVDAFRHAYVSGRFTQEYGKNVADVFGRMNEYFSFSPTTGGGKASTNIDYWNNSISRKYCQKTRKKENLLKALHESLKNGEMIIDLKDPRKYNGSVTYNVHKNKSVIVLKQSATGRNEKYFELSTKRAMTRSQFVSSIRKGEFPGYRLANYFGVATPVTKKDHLKVNNLG